MKRILLILAGLALLVTGCTNNTYSDLRKKENKLIENFISRNNLNILEVAPSEDYAWGPKDFYKVEGYDDFYFHLRERGDTSVTVQLKDIIVTRYKKFALTENADTLSYWTTMDQAYPYEFRYGDLSSCEAEGWHVAVKLMKYARAECEVIVPSKMGFTEDEDSVTPYGYIIKIAQVK